MPEFKDAGHRDHAKHFGENPTTGIDRGPHGIKVTLDQWGPWNPSIMDAYLQSNWGEHPMDRDLDADWWELPIVQRCFNGQTLQQILEGISFWFTIDGVCRPATHQIVRTRQAAFMQHGGRDNDWRHRRFSMPETIHRACVAFGDGGVEELNEMGLQHSITSWSGIIEYATSTDRWYTTGYQDPTMHQCIEAVIAQCKELYSILVDAGIPWQDARRLLPMGLQTYIHGIYDYRCLKDTLSNRLELIMDWEYNCVGQLMVRELRIHCPEIVWRPIMSASDRAMKEAFSGLESWPPSRKYENPTEVCKACGISKTSHSNEFILGPSPSEGHVFVPGGDTILRTHRPEQNPFWILTEDALNGGPVEWIPTNGVYPHDHPKAPKPRR